MMPPGISRLPSSPFDIGMNNPNFGTPAQHGSSEHWAGTVFSANASGYGGPLGMTPPLSPRRSLSPRHGPRRDYTPRGREEEDNEDRDRERDRQRRPPQGPREDQPLPESWGARMLASESKIRELTASIDLMKQVIDDVNNKANSKIEQMKSFVQEVESRFSQLERSLPERIHMVETKSETFVATINALTVHLQNKFKEIEDALQTRPVPPVPPSFGGAAGGTEHTYIGSPLSGPSNSADAQPDPWFTFAQSRTSYSSGEARPPAENLGWGSSTTPQSPSPSTTAPTMVPPRGSSRPFESRDWNAAEIKVAKELKPFNGTHAAYKTWANRVKDHFKKKNGFWGYVFTEIEAQKTPIGKNHLMTKSFNADGFSFDVDLAWASNALWTFVGEHVVDTVYNNRGILSGGGDNGLELWRALFMKHEGGADQVELGGMGSLHSFPQCDKVENLQLWIGKWQEMKDAFGGGISEPHLKSMFVNILPPSVQKEIRERPGLSTLQSCIDHVMSDLGRINDAQLSKLHVERLKHSLSASQ